MAILKRLLFGPPHPRSADFGLLLTRLVVGAFLVYGVADNVLSAERMDEFASFLDRHGFAPAAFWAHLSVYAQLTCGLLFVSGVLTRAAALVCFVNFAVALIMVDGPLGLRAAFPSVALMLFAVLLLAFGAGRWSFDGYVGAVSRSDPRR